MLVNVENIYNYDQIVAIFATIACAILPHQRRRRRRWHQRPELV